MCLGDIDQVGRCRPSRDEIGQVPAKLLGRRCQPNQTSSTAVSADAQAKISDWPGPDQHVDRLRLRALVRGVSRSECACGGPGVGVCVPPSPPLARARRRCPRSRRPWSSHSRCAAPPLVRAALVARRRDVGAGPAEVELAMRRLTADRRTATRPSVSCSRARPSLPPGGPRARWAAAGPTCPHCGLAPETLPHRMWLCPRWDPLRAAAGVPEQGLPPGVVETGALWLDPDLRAAEAATFTAAAAGKLRVARCWTDGSAVTRTTPYIGALLGRLSSGRALLGPPAPACAQASRRCPVPNSLRSSGQRRRPLAAGRVEVVTECLSRSPVPLPPSRREGRATSPAASVGSLVTAMRRTPPSGSRRWIGSATSSLMGLPRGQRALRPPPPH